MGIDDLNGYLSSLRDLLHDGADHSSLNESYYFYVYYSYMLLDGMDLSPVIVYSVGRSWVEFYIDDQVYAVDLNWNTPVQHKDETYLSDLGGTEISIDEFVDDWDDGMDVVEVKRWPKLVQPHSSLTAPPPMSKNPTKPKRPPVHIRRAPIVQPHKRM